ncbi:MAG: primosomal protein N' [Candidatus Aminicenantes bacterium RBG_16_66_30]|nr:MAG: primosomal protein N' [Candidatus Aminicenantes bacterium RBG_16_66_30]
MTVLARVVFPLPLDQSFLYAVPEAFRASARPGARVVAPLGTRRQTGFIVGLTDEPPAAGIAVKPLLEVLDDRPFRDERFLEFTRRLSAEFHSSWGEVLQASLPPSLALRTKVAVALTELGREKLAAKGLGPREKAVAALLAEAPKGRSPIFLRRKTGGKDISGLIGRMEKKGLVRVVRTQAAPPRKAGQDPIARAVQLGLAFPEPLRDPGVLAPLESAVAEGRPGGFCVFGPATARREALDLLVGRTIGSGGRVLYLFPEIAATGELAARFKKAYGRTAVVFHGRMTEKQREEAWRVLKSGRAALVAGTRSALFVETGPLRLVVVDEEQDESYVQAENPSYDARRGAWLRARSEGAVVVFASSRPTVEAFYEAGRSGVLIDLGSGPPRAGVTIVDQARDVPLISAELERRLRANLARGEAAVLFLNRRGYAAQVVCSACGGVPRCPRCDIALVFHKAEGRLVCHYCNYAADVRKGCAGCGGAVEVRRGAGTQAIEEELARLFPRVRIGRFDADAAGEPRVREKLLGDFARGRIPLLVGTQLLVHHPGAPKARLVAVLRPEAILGFSDYRAGQKTFEALSAMLDFRCDSPDAEAVIQTAAPVHFAVAAAAAGDYRAFYDREIEFRGVMGYPPFSHLAEVLLQGRDVRTLGARSRQLRAAFLKQAPGLEVLGPAFAPVARIKDLTRVQFVLKSADRGAIDLALREALPKVHLKKTIVFSYSPFRA